MNAYLPHSFPAVGGVVAVLVAAYLAGFSLGRLRPGPVTRTLAWTLVTGSLLAVERITAGEPPGFRMLVLVASGLLGMKGVVAVESVTAGERPLFLREWTAFALAWVGMEPRLFAQARRPDPEGARRLMARGGLCLVAGALLFAGARRVGAEPGSRWLATLLLLPALSLVVHFGWLDGLAGLWRLRGVRCDRVFRAPLRSVSLGEFWGRRWNLAFVEMTRRAVYRPLAGRVGRRPALLASFALSGLLHEVAISVPVRAGYGLPFLYFALHGAGVLLEGELARRGVQLGGAEGRLWAAAWLVLPLPLLFHPPFLRGVVWPLLGGAG